MNIYWVRHGKTEYNLARRIQGWCDSPLLKNDESYKLAADKLKNIKFDYICSSDLKRAILTKELILNELNIFSENNTYPEFREVHFGKWEGMYLEEILNENEELWKLFKAKSDKYQPQNITGGESIADVKKRVIEGLDKIKTKYGDDSNILIVSHGSILAIMNNLDDVPENGSVFIQKY